MTDNSVLPVTQTYTKTARVLHWVMAAVILILISVGFYMGSMAYSPLKLTTYMMHKSFGMMILGLVIVRIVWRFTHKPPAALPTHQAWEHILAHLTHLALYVAMIGMPMSGWIMSSAGEFPVSFFGLFEFPALMGKNEDMFNTAREVHEVFAFLVILAVGLHIAGALKHRIIDKDATLERMGANHILIALVGILFLVAGGFVASEVLGDEEGHGDHEHVQESVQSVNNAPEDTASAEPVLAGATAPFWTIVQDSSQIRIEFQQGGQAVSGVFEGISGSIAFDPENLDGSAADVKIDVAGLSTGSEERDQQARSAAWFDATEYPFAEFKSESFTKTADEDYTARGTLTIRGQSVPVILPFKLVISDDDNGGKLAVMRSEITLMRLDFGVGQGEWASTDMIGNDVKVEIILHAQHQ